MANAAIFQTTRGRLTPATDTVNAAGAASYSLPAEAALAKYAMTGTFNATHYDASAEVQLEKALELAFKVSPEFVAKCAIYARQQGLMKDMPAFLLAVLAVRDVNLLKQVFPVVCDSTRVLRNFVQIIRSGVVGRKSFGYALKGCIRRWLESRTDEQLFGDDVGNAPSLGDIIKMVHPVPRTEARAAMYRYIVGRKADFGLLPPIVQQYEEFKRIKTGPVPNVRFEKLSNLGLGRDEWVQIARNASWNMTRKNLNTFQRHKVYEVEGMVQVIAERLRDRKAVLKARAFPYELQETYLSTSKDLPFEIREALQDALEHALENVPAVEGQVYVLPDVSSSMLNPATGNRNGSSSHVRCVDVAALVAAAFMRKNPSTKILPFNTNVVTLEFNPRDSVMTNASKIRKVAGGGTNCATPMQVLNRAHTKDAALVIFVSDNESWERENEVNTATVMMQQWDFFKQRNPRARLVCLDITPKPYSSAKERDDVLNIGGFSDNVFKLIASFAERTLGHEHWVGEIEKVTLG